jgi:hypothetical protein
MITSVVLSSDDGTPPVHCADLFSLSGKSPESFSSLEAKADTRESSLSALGDLFPHLQKLRLNNSIIPSVRDIGCTLNGLTFLSLARCNLTSLDGIGTISRNLEELYLAFNQLTDVCDLMGLEKLKVVDLEANCLNDLANIEILSLCPGLTALTLVGNPAAEALDYRLRVNEVLPQLIYLDEKRVVQKEKKSPRLKTGGRVVQKPIPEIRMSAGELERDTVLTQEISDKVSGRPPSAREYHGAFEFPEVVRGRGGQKIVAPPSPRIVRPLWTKVRV